jgi:hypothetical protein
VRGDGDDVGPGQDRLDQRQRIAEADHKIGADQRLNAAAQRIADEDLFDFDAVLLEDAAVDTDVRDGGADFPANVGEPHFFCFGRVG